MRETGDSDERRVIEVLDEHFVIDRRRHQNDLELLMLLK